jgi:hypothetical protein
MSTKPNVEELLQEILGLPEEAQNEIIDALIDGRAEDYGVFVADEDYHGTLTHERS